VAEITKAMHIGIGGFMRCGGAPVVDPYGPEQVINGGFDSDTTWGKNADWTISLGKAHYADANLHQIYQVMSSGFVSGKSYKISLDVSNLAAGYANIIIYDYAYVEIRTVNGTITNNSTYTYTYVCASNSTGIRIYGSTSSGGTWSMDNVSVKEIL
jgi:hypothetical protein